MKYLDRFNEKDILFLDIETAAAVEKLKKSTPLYDAWEYKCRHENEHLRKTGEELTIEEYFDQKAALYAVFGQIVTIVAGRIDGNTLKTKKYTGPEMVLLEDFNNDLNSFTGNNPATILCGWAINGFDNPFINKRMIVHGIKPNHLIDTPGQKPWDVPAIDLKDLWKGTGFYPDSLIATAVALGLPSPKNNMEGDQVSKAFFAGKIEDIASYCEEDVLATANIFRRFTNRPLLTLG